MEFRVNCKQGLIIDNALSFPGCKVTVHLIIILGITSLHRMLREVDNWEMRQTHDGGDFRG